MPKIHAPPIRTRIKTTKSGQMLLCQNFNKQTKTKSFFYDVCVVPPRQQPFQSSSHGRGQGQGHAHHGQLRINVDMVVDPSRYAQ